MFNKGNKKPPSSTVYSISSDLVPIVNCINSVIKYGKRSKKLFTLKLKNDDRSRNKDLEVLKTISSLSLKGESLKNERKADQELNLKLKRSVNKKEGNELKLSNDTFKRMKSYLTTTSNDSYPFIHKYNINTDEITQVNEIQNNFVIFRKHMLYTYELIKRHGKMFYMEKMLNKDFDNILASKFKMDSISFEKFKNKLKFVASSLVDFIKKKKKYSEFNLFKEVKINYIYNQIFEKIHKKLFYLNEQNIQINTQLAEELIYTEIIRIGKDEDFGRNSIDFNKNLMKIIEESEDIQVSENGTQNKYNSTFCSIKSIHYDHKDKKIINKELIDKYQSTTNHNIHLIKEINNLTSNSMKFQSTFTNSFNAYSQTTQESNRYKDTTEVTDTSSRKNEFSSTAKSHLDNERSNLSNNTLFSSIDKSKKDLKNSMSSRTTNVNQTTVAPFDSTTDSNKNKENGDDKTKNSKFIINKNSNSKKVNNSKESTEKKRKVKNGKNNEQIIQKGTEELKGESINKKLNFGEDHPEIKLPDIKESKDSHSLSKNEHKNLLSNNTKNLNGNLLQIDEEDCFHESFNVSHSRNGKKKEDSPNNSSHVDKLLKKQEFNNISNNINNNIIGNRKESLVINPSKMIKSMNLVSNQNKRRSSIKIKFRSSLSNNNDIGEFQEKEHIDINDNDTILKSQENEQGYEYISEQEILRIEPLNIINDFAKLLNLNEKEGNTKRRMRHSKSTKEKLLKDLKNIIDDLNDNYIVLDDNNQLLDGTLQGFENKKVLNRNQHMFFKKTLESVMNKLEINPIEARLLQDKLLIMTRKDLSMHKKVWLINEELKRDLSKTASLQNGFPIKSKPTFFEQLSINSINNVEKAISNLSSIPSLCSKQTKSTIRFKPINSVTEKTPLLKSIEPLSNVDLIDLNSLMEQEESTNNELNRKREIELEILKRHMDFIKKMTADDKEDEQRLLQETREKLKRYMNFDINSLYQDINYNTDNESVLKIEYRINTSLNILGRDKEKSLNLLKNQNDKIIKVVDKKPISKISPILNFE